MATFRCPICGKTFDLEASPAHPFCSDRCRQIDLGRWLKEGYSVPVVRQSDEEVESGQSPNGDETHE